MGKAKIMIVEDDIHFALNLKYELNSMGYEGCKYVTSGVEAIKNVEQVRPDIVLMDIILEGEMNGIDAAIEIHSRYSIPIIFVTGCKEEGTKKLAEKALGHAEYFIKPVAIEDLKLAIEMSLQKV